MVHSDFETRRQAERLEADELCELQLSKLNRLLTEILPSNQFYADKLAKSNGPLTSLGQLSQWPITTKAELQGNGDFAANLSYPLENYVRFHRTSGTHGRPMLVVDTAQDWQWWIDTWQFVLDAAQLTESDRVLIAFSFGPFIGFWTANDAIVARGAMAIPSGGLSSDARLELLAASDATAMCCTPSYALRLAEVAEENGFDVAGTSVSRIIVAGEPGGSVSAIRQRIEQKWNARVVDHTGATEIGPWGYADAKDRGVHVVESEFIAEFHTIDTDQPAQDGELAELIITTLGRTGCPVIRYRTGDLVRPTWKHEGNNFVLLEGGVLGRIDDMLVIRGVNVFPSVVEQILRGFSEVVEYRITAKKNGAMDTILVEVEDQLDQPGRIAKELNVRLGLNVDVQTVAFRSLPRFEAKGKRFIDLRKG